MKWDKFKKKINDFVFIIAIALVVIYAGILSLFGKRVK